jgi:isopenicillin-N N-acyltransferase-like protein
MQFKLIELKGDAYERGRQYGISAAAAIRQNVETYLHLIQFHGGLGRDAAWKAAETFGPIIESHTPDLLLEMRGIADGAGCDLLAIVLINARSELMGRMGECTALVVEPQVTTRGQVLLGQNWDWYTAVKSEPVLLCIQQPGKPEILTLCEAGQVGKIGMNSAGLGVCLNFLSHTDRGRGIPVHVILRKMLECTNPGAAVHEAYRMPRAGAANILLAHAAGEVLDLELTATAADFFYATDGWLVHTNHFESMRLRGGDTGLTTSMSSLTRAARARRLLSTVADRGNVSLDTFRTIFSDHTYGAYAICRHVAPGEPPLQQSATRASIIMDLAARTMYLAAGQPCEKEYRPITCPP